MSIWSFKVMTIIWIGWALAIWIFAIPALAYPLCASLIAF